MSFKNLMYIAIALFIILGLTTISHGEELSWEWSVADTVRQASFLGLAYLNEDLITDNIKKVSKYDRYGFTEHADSKDVTKYVVLSSAIHTGIAMALPKPYREYWQYIGIGVHGGLAVYSWQLSINIKR